MTVASPLAGPALSFHLLPGTHDVATIDWASIGAPWTKCCDASSIARIQQNGSRCLFRPYLQGDDGLCSDGASWAADVLASLDGVPWPAVIQLRNEMDGADPANTVRQYQAFRRALRIAGYPGLVGLGSYGVGWPDWPAYPVLVAAQPDCLVLDEYFGRSVAGSPDLALRHVDAIRRGLIPATLPLFIGECGADDCGDGRGTRGWQQKMTAAECAAQLAIYRAGCAPSVVAAFVFSDGSNGDPQWDSYKTRGTSVEAAIRATWAATPPQPHDNGSGGQGTPGKVTMLQGIDVSSMQPNTNWPLVAQSHQFAFIKATEGTGYTNPYFAQDWARAGTAGIVRGAYHFARPDVNNATAEADYFLAAVGPLTAGDLLVLDLEVGYGDLSGWAQAWLARVAARVGFLPILYTYPSFVTEHGLGTAALATYPLWYASYQQQWPPVPGRWSSIAIWQHSDNAIVPGVAGIVDESYTTLTIDQLRALGKLAQPQPQAGGTMDALTYYQQLGVKIDPTHAIYTACLKPLYDYWLAHKDDVIDGVAIGDLIKPGALIYPEYGAVHGNGQPAACVKLSNRIAGVYQDAAGSWANPYQANLA